MSRLSRLILVTLQLLLSLTAAQSDPTTESAFTKASNDSLLWGAYRPNLYFGIRPRIPKSLMTGLAWARVDEMVGVQNSMSNPQLTPKDDARSPKRMDSLKYTCEQHEGMAGYGWDSYDPRLGGVQTIHDAGNGIDITTEFVKFVDRGENGGSWVARIKGKPRRDAARDTKTAIVFNLGCEGFGTLEVADKDAGDNAKMGFEDDVVINGQTQELGAFTLTITKGKGEHPSSGANKKAAGLDRTRVHSLQVPEAAIWQSKGVMFSSMKETVDKYAKEFGETNLPPAWQTYAITNLPGSGNLHFVQKTFEGAFEFDVIFSPVSADPPVKSSEVASQVKKITKSIRDRFARTQAPTAPFDQAEYLDFSMSMFSNLIGGIGYFHGDQMIDRSYAPEYEEDVEGFWQGTAEARAREKQELEGPYELFTSIPSRPFFPRGFLWDEGFHLLPILDFDIELALQIIKSWFNTMDEHGWIPREQILGPEARSKVPAQFQVQYPHYANPPTLFFVLTDLIDKLESRASGSNTASQRPLDDPLTSEFETADKVRGYLSDLYPLLKRHFNWLRGTQRGELKPYGRTVRNPREAFRWRGSTQTHLLTSGMDDYPRPDPPHPGELHADLMSWMGMMSSSMSRIAKFLRLPQDETQSYEKISTAIKENLDDLHWSPSENVYCDVTVDEYEESIQVCHKGYLSLFPFMLGLLNPSSPQTGALIDLLTDPEQLWSNHGIRSLSLQDPFYGKDENYWRSPVWMNMNYLIVKQLRKVATDSHSQYGNKAALAFNLLRYQLVTTVYEAWKETGFAWEQYHPETGKGQRTQHFTGWTSLVVKIMAMEEVEIAGEDVVGSSTARPAAGEKEEL